MIRIQQLKIKPEHSADILLKKAAKILRILPSEILTHQIVRKSVDARKKPDVYYIYTVDVAIQGISSSAEEAALVRKLHHQDISVSHSVVYSFPISSPSGPLSVRPVIAGMGPAGLFCGYMLAKHGFRPIILERGEAVEDRILTVERFWKQGSLNPESNVQFGEGGAGTFSDGKLNTLVKDKYGRNHEVLEIFTKHGAKDSILYESKPHMGTDVLAQVVANMRNSIQAAGGEVHFNSKITDLHIKDGKIDSVTINGTKKLDTSLLVLAIGHSARDTFSMLYEHGISMEAKPFAVGLRVEHPQSVINESQYGIAQPEFLPAADYKLTAKSGDGRGVYSFCMCPGGYVVNASSEENRLAVNGMSYSQRDGAHANSAVIVSVTPEDFPGDSPLAGIAFQRELEEKAFQAGAGKIPVERLEDFRCHSANPSSGKLTPCMKGNYAFADVRGILPEALNQAFLEGMEQFGKKIHGFHDGEVLVSGIESRTSSPVRICRNEQLQSSVMGIFPCGEGAGYAGGITSAAMDGIRVAEEVADALQKRIGEKETQ